MLRTFVGLIIAMPSVTLATDPGVPPRERASAFATLALKGIRQEYPNKPEHVLGAAGDVKGPKELHPAFYGCYDWHSSVHGHWMLARLLRHVPDLPEAKEVRAVLNAHLSTANLKGEVEYFNRPESKSFERPYGWAWLLKLSEELHGWDDPDAKRWAENLKPLAELIAERYISYFPKQTYPIRTGVHPNTAFGLAFAYDYAKATDHAKLQALVEERAKFYYGADKDVPAAWEPGGNDFFSPSLMEADLMRRVLPAEEFRVWFKAFLPKPAFAPALVADRTDPQLVHLDGLNLSRAWGMRSIATALPKDDPIRTALIESAKTHAAAGLKQIASGNYEGEHWLASFAVYLYSTPE